MATRFFIYQHFQHLVAHLNTSSTVPSVSPLLDELSVVLITKLGFNQC